MQALGVVVGAQILFHLGRGFCQVGKDGLLGQEFGFAQDSHLRVDSAAFDQGAVVRIAGSAARGHELLAPQVVPEGVAGILAAAPGATTILAAPIACPRVRRGRASAGSHQGLAAHTSLRTSSCVVGFRQNARYRALQREFR